MNRKESTSSLHLLRLTFFLFVFLLVVATTTCVVVNAATIKHGTSATTIIESSSDTTPHQYHHQQPVTVDADEDEDKDVFDSYYSSSCGLWVAQSSIPNAGLGVFNGYQTKKAASSTATETASTDTAATSSSHVVDMNQIAIPIMHIEWHNGHFLQSADKDGETEEEATARKLRQMNFRNYVADFFISPTDFDLPIDTKHSIYNSMITKYNFRDMDKNKTFHYNPINDVSLLIPGVGALACCHFGLNNIEEPDALLRYDTIQRSDVHNNKEGSDQDPSSGSFASFHGYQCPIVGGGGQNEVIIEPYSEVFGSYGYKWFQTRRDKIGFVPFEEDWNKAQDFISIYYKPFYDKYFDKNMNNSTTAKTFVAGASTTGASVSGSMSIASMNADGGDNVIGNNGHTGHKIMTKLKHDLWELIRNKRNNHTLFDMFDNTYDDLLRNKPFEDDVFTLVEYAWSDNLTKSIIQALPTSFTEMEYVLNNMNGSLLQYEQMKSTKSLQWLQQNGKCMDYIEPGSVDESSDDDDPNVVATVVEAGRRRGAYSKRFIPKDGYITHSPLIHIPDRTLLNMYGKGQNSNHRNVSDLIGTQLLVNYCFGHPDSTMLLCPYGSTVPYINHDHISPNAKVAWSCDAKWFNSSCLSMTPNELSQHTTTCLAIDYVALRDIHPNEEIVIDYGDYFQKAWNDHVVKHKDNIQRSVRDRRSVKSDHYDRGSDLNDDMTSPLRTLQGERVEGQPPYYSDNIAVLCEYEDLWEECELVDRVRVDNDDGNGWTYRYQVAIYPDDEQNEETAVDSDQAKYIDGSEEMDQRAPTMQFKLVENLSRDEIEFEDTDYVIDSLLPNSFRHEMGMPDDIFPTVWKNLLHALESKIQSASLVGAVHDAHNETQDLREGQPSGMYSDMDFVVNLQLKPSEIAPVVWQGTEEAVHQYAVSIGLDPMLSGQLREYAKEIGVMDMYWELEYDNPVDPGNFRFVDMQNGRQRYYINRPEGYWNSNMHWIQPADEFAYEEYLKVLAAGGFGDILEAIGNYYELDGLFVQGVGFIGVSYCERGYVHHDMSGTGGKFFNVLIPLILEKDAEPELVLRDGKTGVEGKVKYMLNQAMVLGDDAMHATAPCDYRDTRGMRMGASIYIADINEQNMDLIISDTTTIFPVPFDDEWAMAQRARHWERGSSHPMGMKKRKAIETEDDWDDCEELAARGQCEIDIWEMRSNCVKSCKLYMEDHPAWGNSNDY